MRTNYMMNVDDVMEELGVKRSKAYSILKPVSYTHLDVYKRQEERFCERLLVSWISV